MDEAELTDASEERLTAEVLLRGVPGRERGSLWCVRLSPTPPPPGDAGADLSPPPPPLALVTPLWFFLGVRTGELVMS